MENTEGVLEDYLYLRHLSVYDIYTAQLFSMIQNMLFSVTFLFQVIKHKNNILTKWAIIQQFKLL